MAARQNRYFLPANGIARQVITADVCRYLGNDALVKPGDHQGQHGFWVTAYRALTTDMIADLKADSTRWKAEREQAPSSSRRNNETGRPKKASGSKASPDMTPESYTSSRTHEHRQAIGPSFPDTPQPTYVQPQQVPYDEPSGRSQPGAEMSQHQAYDNYYYQQNSANQNGPYNQHMPSYQPVSGATPSSGYPGGTGYPTADPSNPYEFNLPTYLLSQTGREETQPRNSSYPRYSDQAGGSGALNYDPRTGQPLPYPGQAPTQNNAPRYSSRHPERGTDPYDRNDGYPGRGR